MDKPGEDKVQFALRALPSVDKIVLAMETAVESVGRQAVTNATREVLQRCRNEILAGDFSQSGQAMLEAGILAELNDATSSSVRPLFNLSGTVLHNNLGRAVMPAAAVER